MKIEEFGTDTSQGYIGVTTNPRRRWKDHISHCKHERHTNPHVMHAAKKYGLDNIIFEVIFGSTIDQCYEYEKELRPKPKIGWNLMAGGKINTPTPEGLQRIREASKKPKTESQKEKMRWRSYNTRNHINLTLQEFRKLENYKAFEKEQRLFWKAYKSKHNVKISFAEYIDTFRIDFDTYYEIKDKKLFHVTDAMEYESVEHIIKETDYEIDQILNELTKSDGNWIIL